MPLKPTSPADRILEADVLRGLAVLGMVLWNFRSASMGNFRVAGRADALVNLLITVSDIQNTVHLLFAFLFGWGLAQASRRGASGWPLAATNWRKLVALFLIGLANACLSDRTDVLQSFAILGAVFLLFAHRSNVLLLCAAFLLAAAPVLGERLLTHVLSPQAYAGTNLYASLGGAFVRTASYGQMVAARTREVILSLGHPRDYVENLDVLVAFLLGLYTTRRGILRDVRGHRRIIWRILGASVAVRVAGLAWSVAGMPGATLVMEYAKHALAIAYICLVLLLLQARVWRMLLRPLADVGRLALSNYLLQGAAGTTLSFGYGLGLYGRLGMATGEALALAVFAVLAVGSRWWLSKFAFGPAEWLWRTVTYWRPVASGSP